MPLIPASVQPLKFTNGLDLVEYAGRTCYQSESAGFPERFIKGIMRKGHTSVLEHYGAPFTSTSKVYQALASACKSNDLPLLHVYRDQRGMYYANARTIYEVTGDEDITIDFLRGPTSRHRPVFEFTVDRAVSHEAVRHRVASFSQESQRYVALKDAASGLPGIISEHTQQLLDADIGYAEAIEACWQAYSNAISIRTAMLVAEQVPPAYLAAQHARCILPNMTATRVVISQWGWQWDWFFELRCASDAHPDIRLVANQVYDVMKADNDLEHWQSERDRHDKLRWATPSSVSMMFP